MAKKKSMHVDFILLIKSLITGFVLGGVFAFLKLPVPAPTEFAGVIGILGIFLGFFAIKLFLHI